MGSFGRRLANDLLELIFPTRCLDCGQSGRFWCESCQEAVLLVKTDRCPGCQKISPGARLCRKCRKTGSLGRLIVASYYDEGSIKKSIHRFKYLGDRRLVEPLAKILSDKLLTSRPSRRTILTSVPLHWRRLKSRGFNQAELLARAVGKKLDLEYREILSRRFNRPAQIRLKAKERRLNVEGVFQIRPEARIVGRTVVLIDDVATTGATLESAARVLREAGARSVIALVLARG